MILFLAVIACVSVISIVVVSIIRKRLNDMSNELSGRIDCMTSYSDRSNYERAREGLSVLNEGAFIDIPTDLNNCFKGKVVSSTQKKEFCTYYMPYYHEVCILLKKLETYNMSPPETISKFFNDFSALNSLFKQHNEGVVASLLDKYKDFFDHCLKYPLDNQQRRSIISEEDNCLVISSAGSGKTSSIVGKVKYLIEIKGVAPERILLISYTNKAASELTERMATKGLEGYTFHKLAVDIISKVTGEKPSICDNTDSLFVNIYHKLLDRSSFRNSVVEYFNGFKMYETDREQRKIERLVQLSERKNVRFKALFPDMDGRTIYVKSEQENKICFVLSLLGVKFRYEEPYEHKLSDEMHSQYRPDFSIYFEKEGIAKRIYLEHFGVDEHGLVPVWFAKDKNISIEEANQIYNDGISWKKAAHEKFGTQLLVTSSADFQYYDIKDKIRNLLVNAGVPIQEIAEDEIYDLVLPKNSKQEKAFIRLVVTFITLVKSSCRSFKDILQLAEAADDERGAFMIKNIFQPVYEHYIGALRERNQIDFTDAILQATEMCRSSHLAKYDYIIVDEFQDISVDRYNFLRVLREGNPPAKLYCVGDDWQSIYRFSGSDMSLFSHFSEYFGPTEINKIETTYRFGEPLVTLSSRFIQRNGSQLKKNIHSFSPNAKTDLEFYSYYKQEYCSVIEQLVASIPFDKSIFLLGRYSFDDYYLSFKYQFIKENNKFYYVIRGRKIEFLTIHKSKGLEADYVILLQCNKDTYGFPSLVNDDPVLNYVLANSDKFLYGEERRLFYVAITRAKVKTLVLYDKYMPSVFVDEFLNPEKVRGESFVKHPNANKLWTKGADDLLLKLRCEGKSVKDIAAKMGRSQTSIVMRLNKLNKE